MAKGKEVTVDGMIFSSKSEAVRSLLMQGMRKCEIKRAIGIDYAFMYSIEQKMRYQSTDEYKSIVNERAEKQALRKTVKEQLLQERNAMRLKRIQEREAKKIQKEEEKTLRAAQRAEKTANVVKELKKAAKKADVKKETTKTSAKKASKKKSLKVEQVIDFDDANISELLNSNDIPTDIAAEMKKDGLI